MTIKKKQFLFFRRLPPPPKGEYGGLEKLMLEWFERIDYSVNHVIVVVTTGWKERFVKEALVRQLPLTVVETPFDFFHIGPIKRFFDMWDFLKNYEPQGIVFFQAHYEEFGLPELIPASWRAKGNCFMHENTGSLKPPEKSSRKYFGFIPGLALWWQYYVHCIKWRAYVSKKILAVSREIKDRYVSWWGYPADRVQVLYHGVNADRFCGDPKIRMDIRAKLQLPQKAPVFISMARFSPLKRLDRAIKAFNLVFQKTPEAHFVLGGSGPLEEEYRQLASSLPCAGHVHFIGHVDNPADYLRMADIFVLSSDNEGLSIAIMEAMAGGLIAISTDCTGSNEIIQDGRTGFIVAKSDESVAEGMEKALRLSPAQREDMRQQAMQTVLDHFDIDTNVRRLFKTIGIES